MGRISRRTLRFVTRATRLTIVLVLNLALIVGLVTVGLAAHSLGVLAAAGDYLADAAAISVSLLAIALSRRPPTARHPRGYPKATAIAAFLLVVVVLVVIEGLRSLAAGTGHVHGLPAAIVSGIAAIVMLVGALILKGAADD